MAETLSLEIVTPTGVALTRNVTEFTAPSVAGEFGVLPGHIPLLAALQTGIVGLRVGGEETRVAVGPGFAQVQPTRALLLTEKFARKEDVDVVKVRARLKEVGEELSAWSAEKKDDQGRYDLIEEEQWLATNLELIGDPPPPVIREDTRFRPREEPLIEEDAGEGG